MTDRRSELYFFEHITLKEAKWQSVKRLSPLVCPGRKRYGYSQAVKVENTIYVSGQVSHDDKGNIVGEGNMEAQMRQAYANIEKVTSTVWRNDGQYSR